MIAITREVSPAITRCELTHLERTAIDVDVARAQHAAYERLLERLGCAVHRLPADPDMADSVFIEDTAIVLDEVAVITRPGARSRHVETPAVVEALRPHRTLARIVDPGTIDGGDVIVAGRQVFVGRSGRTNDAGIRQLRSILAPIGRSVVAVEVRGCLHLKSAATTVDNGTMLINPEWVPPGTFPGFEVIEIDPREPSAANVLRVGGSIVCAAASPRTQDILDQRGYQVAAVEVSELAKAEGAVTCCSLVFRK